MKRPLLIAAGAAAALCALRFSVRRRFSFSGKVFLITGGSRGLGLVLARQICNEGGRVALLARDADELARAVAELTQRGGGDALAVVCDLLERGQIEKAVHTTVQHFGRLDVVINNAGIIEVGPLEHMKREDFERAMGVHFWAPYHVMMAALPHLRRSGDARIVNIASIGGRIAVPHLAPYCASKFALVGLSDSLRTELAQQGIFITTVAPGMMRTGSESNAQFKGRHAAEFRWFSTAARLPFVSINAERAAAKILSACKSGLPFLAMPISTKVAVATNALLPNTTARALKLVNKLLPGPTGSTGDQLKSGRQSGERSPAATA